MGIDLEGFGATFAAGLLVVVGISALARLFFNFQIIPWSEKALGTSKAVFAPMFGVLAFGLGLLSEDISDKFVDRLGWTDSYILLPKNDFLRLETLFDVKFKECVSKLYGCKNIQKTKLVLTSLGRDVFHYGLVSKNNNIYANDAYKLKKEELLCFKNKSTEEIDCRMESFFHITPNKIKYTYIDNLFFVLLNFQTNENSVLRQYKLNTIIEYAILDTYFSSKNKLYRNKNYYIELNKLDVRRNFARTFTVIALFVGILGLLLYFLSIFVIFKNVLSHRKKNIYLILINNIR